MSKNGVVVISFQHEGPAVPVPDEDPDRPGAAVRARRPLLR